jgi:hypothetical protein
MFLTAPIRTNTGEGTVTASDTSTRSFTITKKPSTCRGLFRLPQRGRAAGAALQRTDVCRLLALRSRFHLKRYALIFLQRLKAFRANFREMREQIFAARIRRNEAKAFSIVEPFDDTGFHIPVSLEILIKTGNALMLITILHSITEGARKRYSA